MGPFPKNFNGDSLIIAETKKNRDFKEIEYKRKKIRMEKFEHRKWLKCFP